MENWSRPEWERIRWGRVTAVGAVEYWSKWLSWTIYRDVPRGEKIVTGHGFSLSSLASPFSFSFALALSPLFIISHLYTTKISYRRSQILFWCSHDRRQKKKEKKTHDNGHDERTMTTTRWLHCIHFRYSERTIGQWTHTRSLARSLSFCLSVCLSFSCYSSILMVGLPNRERERERKLMME